MALNDRWFKEDRELHSGDDLTVAKRETDKALRASTLMIRRLGQILDEDIEKTYVAEETYSDPAWERKVLAAAAERKVLRRIKALLP